MKKFICFIMSMIIMFSMTSVFAEGETSGVCGTNATWSLEKGVLKITGSGEMYDYNMVASERIVPPWYGMDIYSVEVGKGITGVGDWAFIRCENLSKVKLSDTVTTIGSYAFQGCKNLAVIDIPDSVIGIDRAAFSGCRNLSKVNFSENLMNIGENAFYECASLTALDIPGGVVSIGRAAFYRCESLAELKLQHGAVNIGEIAFYKCKKLNTVFLPDTIAGIGKEAFASCPQLKDVYYEGTEAEWANISIADSNIALTGATIHYNSTQIIADDAKEEVQKPQDNTANVVINGNELVTDQPAIIVNGRTLVPLRAIFEVFGFEVQWQAETKTVIATKNDYNIVLTIDDTTAYVNGEANELDVPAQIVNDRTLVPVRFISESIGAIVNWVDSIKLVDIIWN